jgi:hypothetical protein
MVLVFGFFYPKVAPYVHFWPVPVLIASYVSLYMLWDAVLERLERSHGIVKKKKGWRRF